MDLLSITQKVLIRRTDGRVQLASIIKLDGGSNSSVTVEWPEGDCTRGKEITLSQIIEMNPEIFAVQRRGNVAGMASIPPRASTLSASIMVNTLMQRLPAGNAPYPLRRLKVGSAAPRQRSASRQERHQQRDVLGGSDRCDSNWDTARMIRFYRMQMESRPLENMGFPGPLKRHGIVVCVRKRPLNRKELAERELDVISMPRADMLVAHAPRRHVNLVRFLENHNFRFDYTFDEACSNATVYNYTARPLIRHIFDGGMATCFAYGQTGSGKTHTMGGEFTGKQQNVMDGIYAMAATDVFSTLAEPANAGLGLRVTCSFFEIYGSRIYDLLTPGRAQLRVLEDSHQQVQVVGLTERPARCTTDVLSLLEQGNCARTSGHTSANCKSSRSHAIFQIVLRSANTYRLHGKLSLIDLAGNERGADNSSADRRTRLEGAEINKSLLVLKECIRALGRQSGHIPFRGCKLTQVLRDSFIGKKVKTCMIATISPGLRCVEHTLNTLRYADRVKELTAQTVPPKRFSRSTSVVAAPSVSGSSLVETNSLPDIISPTQASQSLTNLQWFVSSTSLPVVENHSNRTTRTRRSLEMDALTYCSNPNENRRPEREQYNPPNLHKPVPQMCSRHSEVNSRHSEVNSRQSEMNSRHAEVNSRHSEVNSRHSEVSSRHSEVNSRHSEVNSRHSEVNSRSTEGNSRHTEENSRNTELNSRNTEGNPRNSEVFQDASLLLSKALDLVKRSRENEF
ncbi:GL11295 [Drosophila persimilis]|uniref:Kinesin-like protein n=1 Tax=Drosophila persimilis TaxID=7234 RepID=B4GA20_DROPE|nr:GL11295 [Drosophila persimilis]